MDVDEAAIGTLEQALADLGTLVVQAEKYRRLMPLVADADRQARTLGADARRLLRRESLGTGEIQTILGEAARLQAELRAAVDATVAGADYRAAVAAYAVADHASLAGVVPEVFAAVEPVGHVPHLFLAVDWTRRGRALTPTVIAAAVQLLAREGLPAIGDDLSAGADATLQAVMLDDEPPEDEPVVLRIDGSTVPVPVFRHAETGTYLIYQPRVRVPFVVELADTLDLDAAPPDYDAYRASLSAALRSNGLGVAGEGGRDDPSR